MPLNASSLSVGDTHSEVVVENLTRTQIVQYAGASGDYNPIHTDTPFTKEIAGYPSVFDGRLTAFGVRFTRQVFPGATLTATATVEAIREEGGQHFVDLAVSTTNQEGQEVCKGDASARIDA